MNEHIFYGSPKTAQEETRVYVINCDEDFNFKDAEMIGDYESIKQKAEELGTVYTLECFQDELNNETIDTSNSFVYIEQPKLLTNAPKLLEALKYVVKYHRENDSGEGELFGLDFVTTCISAIRETESE